MIYVFLALYAKTKAKAFWGNLHRKADLVPMCYWMPTQVVFFIVDLELSIKNLGLNNFEYSSPCKTEKWSRKEVIYTKCPFKVNSLKKLQID